MALTAKKALSVFANWVKTGTVDQTVAPQPIATALNTLVTNLASPFFPSRTEVQSKVIPVTFSGAAAAGACTATGLAVGDKILGVSCVTTPGIASSSFEKTVTVADQIQQSSESDLSTKTYVALVYKK